MSSRRPSWRCRRSSTVTSTTGGSTLASCWTPRWPARCGPPAFRRPRRRMLSVRSGLPGITTSSTSPPASGMTCWWSDSPESGMTTSWSLASTALRWRLHRPEDHQITITVDGWVTDRGVYRRCRRCSVLSQILADGYQVEMAIPLAILQPPGWGAGGAAGLQHRPARRRRRRFVGPLPDLAGQRDQRPGRNCSGVSSWSRAVIGPMYNPTRTTATRLPATATWTSRTCSASPAAGSSRSPGLPGRVWTWTATARSTCPIVVS